MFTKEDVNNILDIIAEPRVTEVEFSSMNQVAEIYSETSKMIQSFRGGEGSAFWKLKTLAEQNGVTITKEEYSNIFIGASLE